MTMNIDRIPNWSDEELAHLVSTIKTEIIKDEPYIQMWVVGSRVGGWHKLDNSSDVDVYILTDQEGHTEATPFQIDYLGARISGSWVHTDRFDVTKRHTTVYIPAFNPETKELIKVDERGINEWIDFRIEKWRKSGYVFEDGRLDEHGNFPYLIVNRVTE